MDNTPAYAQCGSGVSIRGGIIDVRFGSSVPSIHSLLLAGRQDGILIEILSQLGTMILAILLSISPFIFPVIMSAGVVDGDGEGLYLQHSCDRLYRCRYRKGG
jgi:hypothetical protein